MVEKTKEYLLSDKAAPNPAVRAALERAQAVHRDNANPIVIKLIRPSSFIKAAFPDGMIEAALEGQPPAIDQALADVVSLLIPSARSSIALTAQLREAVVAAKDAVHGRVHQEESGVDPLTHYQKKAEGFLKMTQPKAAEFKKQLDEPADGIANDVHEAIKVQLRSMELFDTSDVTAKIEKSLKEVCCPKFLAPLDPPNFISVFIGIMFNINVCRVV